MLFLAGIAPRLGDQAPVQLLLRHLDVVALTDLGQEQTQAHAPLGDLAILRLQLVFRPVQVRIVLMLVIRVVGMFARVLQGLFDLRPDGVEFGVDHAGGHIEAEAVGQLVEQFALHLHAGCLAIFGLGPLANGVAQDVEIIQAHILGHLVVDLGLDRPLDVQHLDIEGGFLAAMLFARIVVREGYGDGALLTLLRADNLILEAGDELVGA